MCSGCFGEYEEFDDEFGADQDVEVSFFDTEQRTDLGTVRETGGESSTNERSAGDDWSRFDVFVGPDYIIELRIVHEATRNRASEGPFWGSEPKRSADASAKYYRTAQSDQKQASSARLAPSKLLMGIALAFALCGAVAVWLALS